MADSTLTSPESIVQALQSALVLSDVHAKLISLYRISDAFSEHAPKLLPNIVTHLSSMLNDQSPQLREWIIHLIDLSVTHPHLDLNDRVTVACQTVQPVADKLQDSAPNVVKRTISALGGFAIVFFSKAIVDSSFATTWQSIFAIRKMLMPLVIAPSVNEGVKLTILKFLQVLVMIMSLEPSKPPQSSTDIEIFPSLSTVPRNHPTLNVQELAALGNATAQTLFTFPTRMESTSSTVITANISLLIELAKERPQFTVPTARALIAIMNMTQRKQNADKIDQASVLRTIKIAMLGLVRSPHVDQELSAQLGQACESLGARWQEIQHRPSIHTIITPAPGTSISGARLPIIAANSVTLPIEITPPPPLPSTDNSLVAQPERPNVLDLEKSHQERMKTCADLARAVDFTSLPLPIIIELIVQSFLVIPRTEMMYALDRAEHAIRSNPQSTSKSEQDNPDIPPLQPHVPDETALKQDEPLGDLLVDDEMNASLHLGTDENSRLIEPSLSGPTKRAKWMSALNGSEDQKPDLDPIEAFRRLLDSDPTVSDDGYLLMNNGNSAHTARKPLRANRGRTRWIRTVARTLMIQPVDLAEQCRHNLCAWVLQNFTNRGDVALAWIVHEWRQDPKVAAKWQLYILDALLANPSLVDPKDIALVRFIVSVPLPPILKDSESMDQCSIDASNDPVMDRIKSVLVGQMSTKTEKEENGELVVKPGLEKPSPIFVPLIRAIKEFADHDPIRRAAALDILFEMASNTSKLIRSPAVLALKKYFPDHPILAPRVRLFASGGLKHLTEITVEEVTEACAADDETIKTEAGAVPDVNSTLDNPNTTSNVQKSQNTISSDTLESMVLAKAGLILALCSRDARLLADILSAYAQLSHVPQVQGVLRSQVTPLIRALVGQYHSDHPGELPPGLVDVLAQFPQGSDSLTLRILVVLTECITVPTQLVDAVRKVHDDKNLGGRFLLPILSYLDKAYILERLGELVDLVDCNSDKSIKVFREATNRVCGGETPTITPTEFIAELHSDRLGRSDRERTRKLIEAIQICITHTPVFPVDLILTVLSGFLNMSVDEWPRLVFRTAMAIYTSHKEVVVTPLKQLLHKASVREELWAHAALLEGWMRLYILMLPHSLALALMLPPAMLAKLLERTPHVREKLIAIIEAKKLHSQPRVVAAWPVLVNATEIQESPSTDISEVASSPVNSNGQNDNNYPEELMPDSNNVLVSSN